MLNEHLWNKLFVRIQAFRLSLYDSSNFPSPTPQLPSDHKHPVALSTHIIMPQPLCAPPSPFCAPLPAPCPTSFYSCSPVSASSSRYLMSASQSFSSSHSRGPSNSISPIFPPTFYLMYVKTVNQTQ